MPRDKVLRMGTMNRMTDQRKIRTQLREAKCPGFIMGFWIFNSQVDFERGKKGK